MSDYTKAIARILKWEGGFAGNIDGKIATMKGITLETYRQFFGKDKTPKDLKQITQAEWDYIFKKGFWDRIKGDKINNQSIADFIVDWTFTSGVWGIKFTQRVLGVKDDGIVGPNTLAAINNYPNQEELFNKLWQRRKKHFEDLAKTPSRKKFLGGWLRRLNDYKFKE